MRQGGSNLDLSSREVELECAACGITMTATEGRGGAVRYYRCSRCDRWVSSTYAEVLKADAQFKARPVYRRPAQSVDFDQVKSRLERWLAALDEQDPYQVLGVSPLDPTERIKARFRELAMECHPDRGGSPDRMRELNAAYERICAHREKTPPARTAGARTLAARAR